MINVFVRYGDLERKVAHHCDYPVAHSFQHRPRDHDPHRVLHQELAALPAGHQSTVSIHHHLPLVSLSKELHEVLKFPERKPCFGSF